MSTDSSANRTIPSVFLQRCIISCSPDQWQVLAAALLAQLCFAFVTVQAVCTENGCQLRASSGLSILNGLIWLMFLVSLSLS